MRRPVRQVALYGYLGSGNIGNDASFETVLGWLRDTHPEVQVRCVTIAPDEVTRRYGVPSALLAARPTRDSGNRARQVGSKVLGRLRDIPHSYSLAGSADAIIVPGMGVLEETLGTRPWGLPFWLFLIAAACRARGRHFVLLDVGADQAVNPVTRWLHVAACRLATHVSYRDRSSAEVMARAGAAKHDGIAPDLAFAHPAPRSVEPRPGRVVVGVMTYYGPADDPVRGAGVRRRYVTTMAAALADLVAAGHQIVLVVGDHVDIEVAWEVCAAVVRACPELPADAVAVREVTTFAELTDEMRQAQVVVASRFHNLICALRLGRPTISVGYAAKSRDLMHAVGVNGYLQDIEHLDAQALVAQVQAALQEADTLAEQILSGSSRYAAEVARLLDRVGHQELGLSPAGRATAGSVNTQ